MITECRIAAFLAENVNLPLSLCKSLVDLIKTTCPAKTLSVVGLAPQLYFRLQPITLLAYYISDIFIHFPDHQQSGADGTRDSSPKPS
ncbi:hypothetical protein Pcinc_014815 [Petrolisthes cinctipes]|uniref:Uncharacterized protein n=1 Tax=Petrolisthes cinctipes TaxID=88211 RepID=A0AAE1KRD5_PETCI|nr:hypothetical protein Pcinc_014815 [Petrolisthes cinctipes]